MARERPSANRLRTFAEEHLLYEAGMLYDVTGKLMNRHHKDDPVVENALLESFGVHSRNLIDFLWADRPMKDTDAIARDWIEGWQPPEMSERLATVKSRVGKEMVHLSYNRLDMAEDEKGWQVLGIGPQVIGAFGKFATEVPDDLVPAGWRDRAYSATGTIPPDRMEDVERSIIRLEDLRTADFPSVPTQGLPPSPDTGGRGRGRPDPSAHASPDLPRASPERSAARGRAASRAARRLAARTLNSGVPRPARRIRRRLAVAIRAHDSPDPDEDDVSTAANAVA